MVLGIDWRTASFLPSADKAGLLVTPGGTRNCLTSRPVPSCHRSKRPTHPDTAKGTKKRLPFGEKMTRISPPLLPLGFVWLRRYHSNGSQCAGSSTKGGLPCRCWIISTRR
jgi:hypothetical protein